MDIEQRNRVRAEARLPLLDVPTEEARLEAARDQADFEREWEKRKPELAHQWTRNRDGWITNMGRYSLARQQVRKEMREAARLMQVSGRISTHDILINLGYRLVEDCWENDARRTYLHDESADRRFLSALGRSLQSSGWTPDRAKLRSFNHSMSGEVIEVEPSGSDASGHLLHHLKS